MPRIVRASCNLLPYPSRAAHVKLCCMMIISLVIAGSSIEIWPVECGSDDCSRCVGINVSLSDPYVVQRLPVVQSSMPLAYSIIADSRSRAFVGSLDGSFSSISLLTGAVLWSVALGFGPLSSTAALYAAPSAAQCVLVMGRSGDIAMLNSDTGSVIWSVSLQLPTDAAPIVVGIFAYFGARDGTLLKLNAATGQTVWSVQAMILHSSARGAIIVTQPVLSSRGYVLFGFNNGLIMAVNAGTAALMWRAYVPLPSFSIFLAAHTRSHMHILFSGFVWLPSQVSQPPPPHPASSSPPPTATSTPSTQPTACACGDRSRLQP